MGYVGNGLDRSDLSTFVLRPSFIVSFLETPLSEFHCPVFVWTNYYMQLITVHHSAARPGGVPPPHRNDVPLGTPLELDQFPTNESPEIVTADSRRGAEAPSRTPAAFHPPAGGRTERNRREAAALSAEEPLLAGQK